LYARLILYCITIGYEVTLGETYRPEETALLYAAQGKGIRNSLHQMKLAADLNLFKDGHFLTDSDAYHDAGEWWESLSTDDYECCWGGRFQKPDGNHFSIGHNGVR